MLEIKINNKNADEVNYLYDRVGWGKYDNEIMSKALENTLYSVSLYEDSKIIGYGRIIGDGICFLHIHDVMVDPDFRLKGFGKKIVEELIKYAESIMNENESARLYVGASKGKEDFYKKLGFVERKDADIGSGMIFKKNV